LPSTSTRRASASAKADIARVEGFVRTEGGQRRRHVPLEPVQELRTAGEQRVQQVALHDRAGHLRGHHRRLGAHHGIWETANSRR
jgi:hypothetical protein